MSTTVQGWVSDLAHDAALGPAAARVVDILATQPRLASYASTAELATRAGVNVATVVRTARQLGFSGWPALRLEIRSRYLASLSSRQVYAEHDATVGTPVLDAIRRDIENLEMLATTVDVDTVNAVAAAIHAASKTVVVGSGTFAAPGLHLAHSGTSMGKEIVLERHFGTHLANTVTRLRPGDCLVTFNFWWLPRQVVEATETAHERGATTCVVTDRRSSPLTEAADHIVVLPSEGVSSFPSLTAASAVVHGILAELTRLGGDDARQAMERTEATWARMGLFDLG